MCGSPRRAIFGIEDHNNPIGWKDNKRITFSSFINYYFREEVPFCWHNLIWHKHHALKYSCYTWLALNGGLKTADELIKRNIGVNSLCSLCFTFNETIPHLLFECDYAFAVLKSLIPSLGDFLLRPRLTDIFLFLEGRSYHSKHQKIIHLLKAGLFWESQLLCGILCWLGRSAHAPVGLPYPWMVFFGNRGWKWADMDDDVATFIPLGRPLGHPGVSVG
ncbi:hypothetical protein M5K25_020640 [Dendrobium thyrsiflorum]|uniref:Reverse transcriptase zinc-binding domain-containing protein n=1 Tax=Dendrobium thyrsiflorum TaxID=117978 RepID=A0ABD0UAF9_DENTH